MLWWGPVSTAWCSLAKGAARERRLGGATRSREARNGLHHSNQLAHCLHNR